jgi:DNA-binding LacI/PurR family transcriptional regulator
MADVAKLAGVSHQTVSRVVNGSADVRAETRERVLAAMTLLDYRPNSMARALATGRSQALGVVRVDTALHGPSSTLFGIERAAHAAGYHVHVASQRWLDLDSTLRAVERLRSQGVDGILVIGARREAAAALRRVRRHIAVVTVEGWPDDGLPGVSAAHELGARLATQHLLELGHVTVWHIAGPADSTDAQQRVRGWQSSLMAAGARVPAPLQGDWSAHSGYELGLEVLSRPDITALFSGNDQMALGLLRRLHEAGRRVPEDISLVGFDDLPESPYFNPPLTSVRWDFLELGRRAVATLLSEIEQRNGVQPRDLVAPSLVVRGSADRWRA